MHLPEDLLELGIIDGVGVRDVAVLLVELLHLRQRLVIEELDLRQAPVLVHELGCHLAHRLLAEFYGIIIHTTTYTSYSLNHQPRLLYLISYM